LCVASWLNLSVTARETPLAVFVDKDVDENEENDADDRCKEQQHNYGGQDE